MAPPNGSFPIPSVDQEISCLYMRFPALIDCGTFHHCSILEKIKITTISKMSGYRKLQNGKSKNSIAKAPNVSKIKTMDIIKSNLFISMYEKFKFLRNTI